MIQKPNGSAFEKLPEVFENHFRKNWTINADAMSLLYSGTPALKTDFTRTGKRTTLGAI
jgi:phosphatidylinositol 4-phosphatase